MLLCILAFLALSNAQQLIDLKSFGKGDTPINGVGSYSIYVSASSDSQESLKQILVRTTSDNKTTSLYELKNKKLYQTSGLLQPLAVFDKAILSTSLSNDQMSLLKGYLYVTTAQQLVDTQRFNVYDVVMSESIKIGSTADENCTSVFLNTNYNTNPWQASTIGNWVQSDAASVSIYEGIPKDTDEKPYSQIFSNPVSLTSNDSLFIGHVEKFSLNLGAFYVKTNKGVQFTIEPSYTDIDGSNTNAMTTTGLYMKPFNSADKKITVLTRSDSRFNGTTGTNLVGSAPGQATVAFLVNAPGSANGIAMVPKDQIQGFSTPHIGDNMTIDSEGMMAGEFFVQYYVIQGNQMTGTTLSGRQTTAGSVETTTKSTRALQLFTSFFVPILGARML